MLLLLLVEICSLGRVVNMLMGVNSTLVLTWLLLMHEVRWHIDILLATAVMLALPVKVGVGSRGVVVRLLVRGGQVAIKTAAVLCTSGSVRGGSRWWTVDTTVRPPGVGVWVVDVG